jgi:hypothetical protein
MKLPKPWIVGLLGSLLILISTFVSQSLVFQYEQQIAGAQRIQSIFDQSELSIEARVWRAEISRSLASIGYVVTSGKLVEAAIGITSVEKFKDIDDHAFQAYSKALTASAIELLTANAEQLSPRVFEEKLSLLESLGERVESLDASAEKEMYEQIAALIIQSGEIREKLRNKALDAEKYIFALKSRRNMTRTVAFIFQICGLLVLLLKDLPRQEGQSKSTAGNGVMQDAT